MAGNHWKTILVFLIIGFLLETSITPPISATQRTDLLPIVSSLNIKEQSTENTLYNLLIITPQTFASALQPLVTHKNKMGISTQLVTLNQLYTQMGQQGRDSAEKIKYYIKYAMETWGVQYVMLVGDFRLMPIRYCYNADNNSGYPEPRFISELYYADIYDQNGNFSSWDTNGNGVYGEWFTDHAEDANIDLYPDVAVGRLACRNTKEVRTMVQKIITYETTTYEKSWFNTMVVVAGDTYPQSENPNWTGYEGEQNTQHGLDNMTGFTPVKLWTSTGSLTGTKDVANAVNNGCGFLYFEGHANPFKWSTHPPNNTSWVEGLNVVSMSQLKNKDMYPVCVVGGCHNLELDVHPLKILQDPWYYYTWIPVCWGWALTKKIGGGSIATLGCTGLGMSKEDKKSFSGAGDFLEPTFFYEYGTNGTHILGNVWKNAITDYLNVYPINWSTPAANDSAIDAKTVQQWALLGDPSLLIGGYPAI